MEVEEWKTEVLEELDRLVTGEYDQLGRVINSIEASSDHFDAVAVTPERRKTERIEKVAREQETLIRGQQAII